jgi:hypothetical protein
MVLVLQPKQGLPRRTAERLLEAAGGTLPSGIPRQRQDLKKGCAYRQSRAGRV